MDEHRDEKGKFTEGNPGGPGRPKFSPLSILREELQKIPDDEKETYARIFVQKYIKGAIEAVDGVAMRDIIDRFDGKPKQHIAVYDEKDAEWLELYKQQINEAERKAAENNPTRLPESSQDNNS